MEGKTYQALTYELMNTLSLEYEQAVDVIEYLDSQGLLDDAMIEYVFEGIGDDDQDGE